MKVVFCEPDRFACVIEVKNDLNSLYELLDCDMIQAVYPWEDSACIICDDEGKITGKDLCRALRDEDGDIYDVVAGAFIVAGLGEDNFDSLTDKQADFYWRKFYHPELFMWSGGTIVALPYDGFSEAEDDT